MGFVFIIRFSWTWNVPRLLCSELKHCKKDKVTGLFSIYFNNFNIPIFNLLKLSYRIDGYCRHVVATLFEVLDFLHDEGKTTCTSKPCTWRRRACEADKLTQPIPATQLDTSVLSSRYS